MTALLVAGVALGGALGAACRFVVDGAVQVRRPGSGRGILLVNVAGSLLLGVLTGLVLERGLAAGWATVLGTGFCGGATTFSTTSLAGVRLVQQRQPGRAALVVLGTLALTTAAAVVGLALAAYA